MVRVGRFGEPRKRTERLRWRLDGKHGPPDDPVRRKERLPTRPPMNQLRLAILPALYYGPIQSPLLELGLGLQTLGTLPTEASLSD